MKKKLGLAAVSFLASATVIGAAGPAHADNSTNDNNGNNLRVMIRNSNKVPVQAFDAIQANLEKFLG